MSNPGENITPTLFGDLFRSELEEIVTKAVRQAISQNGHGETKLLTPEELADRLQVPRSWVYEQSRQGNIPTHRIGKYVRFNLHEVLASQKKD